MDNDEDDVKDKEFQLDVGKFPLIFQYGLNYIKNEESLHAT